MKEQKTVSEQLTEKYWKVPQICDLRDLVFQSAQRFGNKAAFEVRTSDDKIVPISYNQLKQDVINLGTGLIRSWSCRESHWRYW